MKKLVLMIAIIGLTGITFAQQKSEDKKSEPMKKTVIARLTIKKESADSFMTLAQKMVEVTRKEQGCMTYSLYKNCFSNDPEFVFYEEYKDQASLDYHNNSEHLKKFLADINSFLSGKPIIEVF